MPPLSGKGGLWYRLMVNRAIVAFHQDEEGHWVADLECGHSQHMRHEPPWQNRAWVLTPEGRERFVGVRIECRLCGDE